MRHPEAFFLLIIGVIGFICLILFFLQFTRKRKQKQLIKNLALLTFIISLGYIWFTPIYIGQRGEAPVCKFRFQVFEFDRHDYSGYGDWPDLLFKLKPKKYGSAVFYRKIGGWQEYFGLKSFEYQTAEEYFGKQKTP